MWGSPLDAGRNFVKMLRQSQVDAARRACDAALDVFLEHGTTGNLDRLRTARQRLINLETRP